jgi:hypothetical protein
MATFSTYTHDSSKRIAQVVRQAERNPHRTPARTPPRGQTWYCKTFFVTSWTRSGNGGDTPGYGVGTMCVFLKSTGKYAPMSYTNIPLYADAGVTLTANTYAQFIIKDGFWFYDVTACTPTTYPSGPTAAPSPSSDGGEV